MAKPKAKKEIKRKGVSGSQFFVLTDFKKKALLLFVVGLIFYANSFYNQYALDDGIVIQKNEYVQQGFRGIPKIFKTDAYDSYYRQMNAKQQLSGGRYRPLSVVTFAVEQQLFGSKEKIKPADDVAFIRHVLNVLLYILSIIILLYFLQTYIFKDNPLVALITCLIFLIHPLHTEVVANVKSRDEILSFLFIILTFIAVFRYRENKKGEQLFYGLLFYFLALLSKEYAITLLVLIPMLLYIVKGDSLKKSLISVIPFFLIAGIYLLIRLSIVGMHSIESKDVLNNPFMYATPAEKWATKIEILDHYLRLLFYPSPLSSDYSYYSIPYTDFTSGFVWLSIVIHLSMVAAMIVLFFRRNILSFALAFYLLHLFLISNFVMDIGATMGERLAYHSSFGFAICIAVFVNWVVEKVTNEKIKKVTTALFCGALIIAAGWIVIPRNADWKNDNTLFTKDAETVPNSALVNGNAGKAYIDMSEQPENKAKETELIKKAIYHFSRAIAVHKTYVNGYLNIGVAYFKLKNYDEAKKNWDIVRSIYPNNPYLKINYHLLGTTYYNEAMTIGAKQPLQAIFLLEEATEVDPANAEYWYNLGGASFTVKDYEKARKAWTMALQLKPDYKEAQLGMSALPAK